MNTVTRMSPSTIASSVDSTGSQLVSSAEADLEHQREADRDREGEDDLPAADLGLDLAVLVALLRGDVCRNRERAKPIASDSPSATTPRTTGRRQILRRCMGDSMSRTTP